MNEPDIECCPCCNSDDLSERLIYPTNECELTCNRCQLRWLEETEPVGTYSDDDE